MEYVLHIKTLFDCTLVIANEEYELTPHIPRTFLCTKESINILFYPNDNLDQSLPFSFKFEPKKIEPKKNVKVTIFPQNNFLIEAKPFFLTNGEMLNIHAKTLTFGGTTHTLFYAKFCKENLTLECETSNIHITHKSSITALDTKTSGDYLLVYAKTENEKHIVSVIKYSNDEYKLVIHEEVDKLEKDKEKILTYKNLHDFAGHGIVSVYTFSPEFSFQKNLAYDGSSPEIQSNKELIPYAFFELIKLKNYKLARTYLASELSSTVTNNNLKNYFGSFTDLCQPLIKNSTPGEIALIYTQDTKNLYTAKVFYLDFDEDNKIKNIEERFY